MNKHHDPFLAQQLVFEIDGGLCKGRGAWWSRREALHARATTREEAAAATRPAIKLCSRCPFYDECEQWAQLDDYTGIAAGTVYINGRRRKEDTVIPRPPQRPRLSALDVGLQALGDAIEEGRYPMKVREAG